MSEKSKSNFEAESPPHLSKTSEENKFFHFSNLKRFFFTFVIIFLFGNLLVGLLEGLNLNFILPSLLKLKLLRLSVISEFLQYFLGISYTAFSFIALYKTTKLFQHQLIIKSIYILYFISIIYVLTVFHSNSPIALISRDLFNKLFIRAG